MLGFGCLTWSISASICATKTASVELDAATGI
jgi:hypothetical protein